MLTTVAVALPFISAAALACVPSWRAGLWINAASSGVLFGLTCLLPWYLRTVLPAHLALVTSFIAMTTSWFGWRDIRAELAARRLDRRRTRLHQVAFQGLIGAVLLAVLADSPALTWFGAVIAVATAGGLTGVVRTLEAQRAAGRLVLLCGSGLMLALFGMLLLYLPPEAVSPRWSAARSHLVPSDLAAVFLVLGYGGLAGLVPLHSSVPDAVAEGTAQGAALIGGLLANVPLFAILRLRSVLAGGPDAPVIVFLILGLATLLLAACCLWASVDARRSVASAGTAQVGIVVFAFGLGDEAATFAGLLLLTLLSIARAAVAQCQATSPTDAAVRTRMASLLLLAALPIFALFLLAGPTARYAPWLLLPLGAGALLTSAPLLGRLPTTIAATQSSRPFSLSERLPIWLQLAVVASLAVAMPGPVVGWFRAMAEFR